MKEGGRRNIDLLECQRVGEYRGYLLWYHSIDWPDVIAKQVALLPFVDESSLTILFIELGSVQNILVGSEAQFGGSMSAPVQF
jgi:hypothetical protein